MEDGCDILVVQGADAGGHQWAQGASVMSLIPEVVDMLAEDHKAINTPIIAAGGIMDGRGLAAGLTLGNLNFCMVRGPELTAFQGANGAVMGTRVCSSP